MASLQMIHTFSHNHGEELSKLTQKMDSKIQNSNGCLKIRWEILGSELRIHQVTTCLSHQNQAKELILMLMVQALLVLEKEEQQRKNRRKSRQQRQLRRSDKARHDKSNNLT